MDEHKDICEQLSAYVDGELTEEEARRVQEAAARDAALAAELKLLRDTRQLVHSLPRQPAPEGFSRRVMTRAERLHLLGAPASAGPYRSFRWISAVAAAVVLFAAGLVGYLLVTWRPASHTPVVAGPDTRQAAPTGALAAVPDRGSRLGKLADKGAASARAVAGNAASDEVREKGASESGSADARSAEKVADDTPGANAPGAALAMRTARPSDRKSGADGADESPLFGAAGLKREAAKRAESDRDAYKQDRAGRAGGHAMTDADDKTRPNDAWADGFLEVLACADNERINTDNLGQTQKELEALFRRNNVEATPVSRPDVAGLQVQYVVRADTPRQLVNLKTALKAVRSRQHVPQDAVGLDDVLAMAAQAKAEAIEEANAARRTRVPALPGPAAIIPETPAPKAPSPAPVEPPKPTVEPAPPPEAPVRTPAGPAAEPRPDGAIDKAQTRPGVGEAHPGHQAGGEGPAKSGPAEGQPPEVVQARAKPKAPPEPETKPSAERPKPAPSAPREPAVATKTPVGPGAADAAETQVPPAKGPPLAPDEHRGRPGQLTDRPDAELLPPKDPGASQIPERPTTGRAKTGPADAATTGKAEPPEPGSAPDVETGKKHALAPTAGPASKAPESQPAADKLKARDRQDVLGELNDGRQARQSQALAHGNVLVITLNRLPHDAAQIRALLEESRKAQADQKPSAKAAQTQDAAKR